MNSEAFLSLYLEEIGVQTSVSSFLVTEKPVQTASVMVVAEPAAIGVVPEPVDMMVAEPNPVFEVAMIEARVAKVSAPEVRKENVVVEAPPESVEAVVMATPEAVIPTHDLTALQKQAAACTACELGKSRNQVVFGSGSQNADLVFVGDAPGRDEDLAGLPLVGRSGELFDRMLAAIQLKRENVYIMNGVKCRPHHGRDPKPEEFAMCERWLVAQLEILQPKMICMLGRVVAQALLKSESSLKELRAGEFHFRGIPVLVIDHPSYLLRSQQHKRRAWQDLNRLKDYYQKLSSPNYS